MTCTRPFDARTRRCTIRTVTNTVLATPNVVFEVCVCPPKVANQCPCAKFDRWAGVHIFTNQPSPQSGLLNRWLLRAAAVPPDSAAQEKAGAAARRAAHLSLATVLQGVAAS